MRLDFKSHTTHLPQKSTSLMLTTSLCMESNNYFIIILILFSIFQPYNCTDAQRWIQAGYWYAGSESPIPEINSALFNHLICGFANLNSTSYELFIPFSQEYYFTSFTKIVKRKNPSVTTLLSVWNGEAPTVQAILGHKVNSPSLSSMLKKSSTRKSFIDSSIKTARRYGFQGIDLCWLWPKSVSDMINMRIFLDEWRASVNLESRNSNTSKLILTMALHYVPYFENVSYPIEALHRNLDWAHVVAYDYHLPSKENSTAAHAALYDPSNRVINTDYGIREWLRKGFPANKLVLGLPYHGYAWTLVNPKWNSIGADSVGLAVTKDGSMSYKYIKWFTRSYGANIVYNDSYVVNYCFIGSTWIGFDDVEAIKAKIAYAKKKKLVGYNVFQVNNDDNWVLSRAAHDDEESGGNKRKLLLIIMLPIALIIILLAFIVNYLQHKRANGMTNTDNLSQWLSKNTSPSTTGSLDKEGSNLKAFNFCQVKKATNNFSSENKLGGGGFGPVYKGNLSDGQEIAVKRLSQASTQGVEEFKNEVSLTARLQHVNLVRVLGFCSNKEEKMLIYQYMPNKSLDQYIFDPMKRNCLNWIKLVNIIDGIIQGLLYLQEYSNFTIIHRDIKSSNILLDNDMNPKISDFGMAKLFRKDELEANTDRICGTYGFVPPEYVRKGVYSMKYDVYSFGVLLLQIISGKRTTCYYGNDENLSLLEYAYMLWTKNKGIEFVDKTMDDSVLSCKLIRCLQLGLLCVQEDPKDRPSMLEIYSMIRNDTIELCNPKKPAYSVKVYEHLESRSFQPHEGCCSVVDDELITQVVGR